MNFLKLEQPPGVPHLPIKLLKTIGIIGRQKERLRILPIFLVYIFIIALPKCFLGYPNFELAIFGIAELFFVTNTFSGVFLLFINGYKLEQFIIKARAFSQKVLREPSPAIGQHLTTQHEFIHKVTRLFFLVVMYAAHFYVFAPSLSTIYTLYRTASNVNETIYYTLHMEENFYGLPTRTSGPHYILFGAIMTPTTYLCAYAGTVKILAVSNIIVYCTLYFQLIQVKLQTVAQDNSFHQELKSIVMLHQDALNCAKLLESITSFMLLQQLLMCVLIWCSMLLYFSVSGFNVLFMNLFVLFAFETTETFAYCYLGEQLSNESARVARVVYDCNWEVQTPAIQRDLELVLVRAQTPVGITAAKFCLMNMEQLGIMLKTTYSLFVILRDQF